MNENLAKLGFALIPLLPLFSFAVLIFVGRRIASKWGERAAGFVAIIPLGISFLISITAFALKLQGGKDFSFTYYTWTIVGDVSLSVGVLVDGLTVVMLMVVCIVAFFVEVYSLGYMHDDLRFSRFYAYLSLFSFAMLGLVLAGSFIIMFMCWELVGLCSYFLIGFWFEKNYDDPEKITPRAAGMKAFITTKLGDIGLFVGMLWLFTLTGSFGIKDCWKWMSEHDVSVGITTAIGILMFCGAIGKSAQFPLHVWLPDAMEGPTPVSALIHAATMVAAGVYLTARALPLMPPEARMVVAYIGGFTALFAATIAIAQNDIKRVLAYSTISQLGYMVLALGCGSYQAGMFHLATHAMFKACLFLCSGSVIHAMEAAFHATHKHGDPNDMTNMGGLRQKMPWTFRTMLIATLALSGVPFFSGFLSKDAILGGTLSFAAKHHGHFLLPFFGFSAALLTAFYMFRLIYMTFFGEPKLREVFEHLHESPRVMTVPLMVLATLSFWIFFSPDPSGLASHGWFYRVVPNVMQEEEVGKLHASGADIRHTLVNGVSEVTMLDGGEEAEHGHGLHIIALLVSISIAGSGILLATWVYYWRRGEPAKDWSNRLPQIHRALVKKWYFDEIYKACVIRPFLAVSRGCFKFDLGIIDGAVNGSARLTVLLSWFKNKVDIYVVDGLVNAVGSVTILGGNGLRHSQTGRVQNYLLLAAFVVGTLVIVTILLMVNY